MSADQTRFDALIDAFVQDQSMTRYETWDQLVDYCSLSANPVGRLVLMLLGEPREDALFLPSDAICTALQLTNHWQDVRRDILERDRIYIPSELIGIEDFEQRLEASARQGYAVDATFLQQTRELIRDCVQRTHELYDEGSVLLERITPASRPVIRLFMDGGMHILRQIELWNHETILHRPSIARWTKAWLVARAWLDMRLVSRDQSERSSGSPS